MPQKTNFNMPLIDGTDPRTIEYYIKTLMNCTDALIAIKEHHPAFREAQYEARNKDMLCIYMLLDALQDLISDMKKENAFRQNTEEGMKAVMEILPEYVISEIINSKKARIG